MKSISVFERALYQAEVYKITPMKELIRLMIHGILHLAGLDDQDPVASKKMKAMEDRLVEEATGLYLA